MITEKTLKKAVNELLKVRWPDIRRYGIEVTEGYIPPCFFVNLLLLSEEDAGANTVLKKYNMMIDYFQKEINETDQYEKVGAIRKMLTNVGKKNHKHRFVLPVKDPDSAQMRYLKADGFTYSYIGTAKNILEIEFDLEYHDMTAEAAQLQTMEHVVNETKLE
jgi:hypothetical protein